MSGGSDTVLQVRPIFSGATAAMDLVVVADDLCRGTPLDMKAVAAMPCFFVIGGGLLFLRRVFEL